MCAQFIDTFYLQEKKTMTTLPSDCGPSTLCAFRAKSLHLMTLHATLADPLMLVMMMKNCCMRMLVVMMMMMMMLVVTTMMMMMMMMMIDDGDDDGDD